VVLVFVVAVLAVTAVVLVGGGRLAALRVRAVRLLVAAAVVQIGTSVAAPGSAVLRGVALVLTALLVALFMVGNRALAGTPLIGAGLLLNVVVIAANGAMPVSVAAAGRAGLTAAELGLAQDGLREPVDDSTRLRWLGDVIPFALPLRPQVVSPGDVLVASGVGLLLVGARTRHTPRRAVRSTILERDSTTSGSYS